MSLPQPDDPLHRELAEWRLTPQRNAAFRASVWSRIQTTRTPSPWTKFARAHAALVGAVLFGAIIAGAWTGRTEARERTEADRSAIAATYVHSLDARWMRHP